MNRTVLLLSATTACNAASAWGQEWQRRPPAFDQTLIGNVARDIAIQYNKNKAAFNQRLKERLTKWGGDGTLYELLEIND